MKKHHANGMDFIMRKAQNIILTAIILFILFLPLSVYASQAQTDAPSEDLNVPKDNWIGWDWKAYYEKKSATSNNLPVPEFTESSGLASFLIKIPAQSSNITPKTEGLKIQFKFDVEYYSNETGKLIKTYKNIESDAVSLKPLHKHGTKIISDVLTGESNVKLKNLSEKKDVNLNVYLFENNIYLCQAFVCQPKSYVSPVTVGTNTKYVIDRKLYESKELTIPSSASPILRTSASNLWLYKVKVTEAKIYYNPKTDAGK